MNRKVDFDAIPWEKEGILYRGNSQCALERLLITDWVNEREASYHGNAFCDDTGAKATFVTNSLINAAFYAQLWVEGRSHSQTTCFTIFPVVMAINAEPYRDRIFWPSGGEGIYIAGRINERDIVPVFGLGFDKVKRFSKGLEGPIKRVFKSLMKSAGEYRLSEKAFIDRFKKDGMNLRTHEQEYNLPLEIFGRWNFSEQDETRIRKAVKKLEEFYQKRGF